MKAKPAVLLVCGALSFVQAPILASPPAESDWPCEIAAQPDVAATAYLTWKSARERAHSWRSDPDTAALIADVAPRSISVEEGAAKISAHIEQAQDRDRAAAHIVSGLVETINTERRAITVGIRRFSRRQAELGKHIEVGYQAFDAGAKSSDPAAPEKQAALQEQIDWDTRIFEDRQRMLPLVCKQPDALERRLKLFLDAALAARAAHVSLSK